MFTLNEITRITAGCLLRGDGLATVRGVCIDSRKVKKGDLFIAVKGPRFDGHDFVHTALQSGAVAAVVSKSGRQLPSRGSIIRVDDTVRALGWIARAYRRRFSIPVIAVTGSAGKTTTKELIAAVLKTRFRVLKNTGTENNQFGVPLTILKLKPCHQVLVLELGTNRPGDIPWLASITEPDVAVMTNIGESHLEQLKTPRRVFLEKKALVAWTKPSGTVIINRDDRFLRHISATEKQRRVVTCGIGCPADYRATDVRIGKDGRLRFHINGRETITLKAPAPHNVYNALAAFACGRLLHMDSGLIGPALTRCRCLKGRQHSRMVSGIRLIDDSYNSNPVSFQGAVETLGLYRTRGRKILVCGDMLELGRASDRLHDRCGRMAASCGIDMILGWGRKARRIIQAARASRPGVTARHFRDLDDLHRFLTESCRPQDIVLVKGSRGMRMERTVMFLAKNLGPAKGR